MSNGGVAPIRPGEVLAGKYRVEKVLGAGAMGVVVAAMHMDLQERRAIKFMLPSMLDDVEGVERFLREARAAVRLKSQHVAKIHDIGRLDTGAPYMVMEYLEGSDLKHVLAARGPLPVHEAVTYLLQACEAIAEAHAIGVVHRDLKPANLFLTTGVNGAPCVKILDFGIAKVLGGEGGVDMTKTSALLGTPLYMSPEQMRGARSVDGRSDLWALGAILYRMLTGRTPFSGSSVTEVCAAVVADQPDPPAMLRPEVPPALEAAVMRCLEKSPARRFATASELAAAIAPFASPHAVAAPAPAPYPAAPAPASPASQSWSAPSQSRLQMSAPHMTAPQQHMAASQPHMAASQPHTTAPPGAQLRPALAGTAILDSSFAVPSAVASHPAAHGVAAPPVAGASGAASPATSPVSAQPTLAAAPKSSTGMLAFVGVMALLACGAGAAAAMHFVGRGATAAAQSAEPVSTATAATSATAATTTSATTTTTNATTTSATATAAPPVASASAIATAAATGRPPPAAKAKPKPKPRDAFGSDRK